MASPEQIESRRAWLASLSEDGGPLTPNAPHSTINDRRYFRMVDGEPVPTPARRRLHAEILRRWLSSQPEVRLDRAGILLAGPPGAGKSSTHANLFAGSDRNHWRELDSDIFKGYLLEAAITDGSLQEMLPENLRMPVGQSYFYPNELSALVHRESTQLFAVAAREAIDRGDNLVIDGTMAWKPWAEELVGRLTTAGYSIQIVDVEAPQHVAAERIVSRWRQGFLAAAAEPANPGAQMGGRWIPRAAVDGLFTDLRELDGKPLHGKSVTEVNAREVSEESSAVARYDLYRTKAVDRGADHVERHERVDGGDLHLTWQAPDNAAAPGPASTPSVDPRVRDGLLAAGSAFQRAGGKIQRTTEPGDRPESSGPELDPPSPDAGPEL